MYHSRHMYVFVDEFFCDTNECEKTKRNKENYVQIIVIYFSSFVHNVLHFLFNPYASCRKVYKPLPMKP